ncbi:hypothetical protein Aple_079800 [Acrocarpospora pleiomorpha]|uniref:HTH cro/C1-type domain-containing protein n=1 Tax=Acrocarpospora pleiomorpha TaxID=90975 RepID=A0A5M3XZV2_9ACTN|nr:helix-turn-helix transcriptional regulator [Acrocarpospora pleiomorpha]GES25081.1 hypothetical protein Aple_079800 [Acrocarpospora pleiomorpha]
MALRHWRKDIRDIGLRPLADEINWSYSHLAKWERGEQQPHADAIKTLDAKLNAGGYLVALHAAVSELDQLRRGTLDEEPLDEDGYMERRELMRNAAAFAAAGAVAPVLTTLTDAWRMSSPDRSLPGASVTQAMIDDWENAADVHVRRAYFDPPATVLAAVAVDYTDMAPHLSRTQPAAIQRDLAHAAARHTAVIAGKWFDLGNSREAHRWWAKTRELSEQSSDPLLASWLRSCEVGYRQQDPQEDLVNVLSTAQEARRLAGDRSNVALVSALSAEAQALATMGRSDEAITALLRTEEVFTRLPAQITADRDWLRRGTYLDRSLIYTLAGDSRRAAEAQSAARNLYPATHRSAIVIQLHGAALQARTDPEQGADEALRIVGALPTGRRDTRVIRAAHIVLDVAPENAHLLPAARELRALTAA